MELEWRTFCPGCDSRQEEHMSPGSEQYVPVDGDLSICAYCGTMGTFQISEGIVALASISDEEKKHYMQDPDVMKAYRVINGLGLLGTQDA